MVVPETRHDWHTFYERLGSHDVIKECLHGEPFTALIEPTRPGYTYGCTPRDVLFVLSNLPAPDLEGLNLLVLRQPTRKQDLLQPVWGRCLFEADFGSYQGAAIMLEAINLRKSWRFPSKLSLGDRTEISRLVEDGHDVEQDRRRTTVRPNEPSVRNTILYRTLLHEVGHWVDWQDCCLRPARHPAGPPQSELKTTYFARPDVEREEVAHRYATRHASRLHADGLIPFEPL